MPNRLIAILSATVLSGALSGIFFTDDSFLAGLGIFYGPGVFFGVITGALFILVYQTYFLKALLWAGASTLSWYLALRLYTFLSDGDAGVVNMILAGVAGAILLSSFYWLLIRKISWKRIFLTIASGGLGAAIMYAVLQGEDAETTLRYVISFVVWQTGVGLALTFDSEKNK